MKRLFFALLVSVQSFLKLIKRYLLPSNFIVSSGSKMQEHNIIKTSYDFYTEEEKLKSYNHFKKYFPKSIFFDNQNLQRAYSIKKAIENDNEKSFFYLEFGVWKGDSINFLSSFLNNKEIYGFDSFKGLREDWLGGYINHSKGKYDLKKKLPNFKKNVKIVEGWVQDTLIKFLNEKKPNINFVHMDVDTYESSKFILKNIKPYLVKDAIIIFDELYDFPGWEEGEHKALMEVFDEKELRYLAFNKFFNQVTIKFIKDE